MVVHGKERRKDVFFDILKPVSADDIVYGKKYIFTEMWYSGGDFHMTGNHIVFVEELPKDYIGRRALVVLKGKTKERYLESFGLIPEKRFHFHRVFEKTSANVIALLFVKTPLDYLVTIGFSEKEALAEISKKKNGPRSH